MEKNLLQEQIGKLKQRKELLIILLFLFVIVIAWIGLSLFVSQQKLGITPEQKKLATPITPNIDTTTLEKIEQKITYSDSELANFPIYALLQDGSSLKMVDVMEDGVLLQKLQNSTDRNSGNEAAEATSAAD